MIYIGAAVLSLVVFGLTVAIALSQAQRSHSVESEVFAERAASSAPRIHLYENDYPHEKYVDLLRASPSHRNIYASIYSWEKSDDAAIIPDKSDIVVGADAYQVRAAFSYKSTVAANNRDFDVKGSAPSYLRRVGG